MQCGFCVGKILIISFSFNFCIACAFTLESSLLMITLALFLSLIHISYINIEVRAKGAVLSGLSVDGCILLPMTQKKAKTLNTVDSDKKDRKQLIAEARDCLLYTSRCV